MAKNREDRKNTTDESLKGSTALNASTAVKLVDSNENRYMLTISNTSSIGVWIRKRPASDDNNKTGTYLPKKSIGYIKGDKDYTGEVSAIAESGTPTIYWEET